VLSIIIIYAVSYVIGDITIVGVIPFPTSLSWYIGVVAATLLYFVMTKKH